MIAAPVTLQNMIAQRVQTPVCKVMVQTATSDGSRAATQTILPGVLSWSITRNEDPSSNVAQITFADDLGEMTSTNPNGKFAPLFQPGVIDTKFIVYLGLEGNVYPNTDYFDAHDSVMLQKFTGFVQTDSFQAQQFTNTKTLSLIDLTNQFRFPVNDTYPHPLYGNQTLSYFDPTYNLTPINTNGEGMATEWECVGKMFTTGPTDPIYGSTHINVAVYVDTTGGSTPSGTAMDTSDYTFDNLNGILTLNTAIPATSVVSLAGNPTYMAPEIMVRKILLELANWSPDFLALDVSNILLPQFVGSGQSVWACLALIAAQTSPRFLPWEMWADENGYLNFYETRVDGPPVKTFLEGRNIVTSNYSFDARQLRTVVRADGTVIYPSNGSDQPVVSIAYDLDNINKYGQTEPYEVNSQTTQNVRHLSPTQAVSYLNMLTAAALAQLSRPVLSCQAEIWPDMTLQPGDKIAIKDSSIGMDRQFIITQTQETGQGKIHKEVLQLQEFYDTINYMVGIPAGVNSDAVNSQGSATAPPTLSIIGAVRAGNGVGTYPFQNGQYVTDKAGNQVFPIWNAHDPSAMHFDVYLNSLPQNNYSYPNNGQLYTYYNLPPGGYNWTPSTNAAGQTVYYGVAPSFDIAGVAPGTNLYVGPDSVFYQFIHAPPIQSTDVTIWNPPGNQYIAGIGSEPTYEATAVNVYLWQWWYLCLDSTLGAGKFYRPVQRVNVSQDAAAHTISASGGLWVYNSWSAPPGPTSSSGYYGNVVVGVDNYYYPPPGFVGVDVMGDGVDVGCAFGPTVEAGTSYTGFQKLTTGHYCIFACNDQGQRQFMRIPFYLAL
jgi:hypothetical protein